MLRVVRAPRYLWLHERNHVPMAKDSNKNDLINCLLGLSASESPATGILG